MPPDDVFLGNFPTNPTGAKVLLPPNGIILGNSPRTDRREGIVAARRCFLRGSDYIRFLSYFRREVATRRICVSAVGRKLRKWQERYAFF